MLWSQVPYSSMCPYLETTKTLKLRSYDNASVALFKMMSHTECMYNTCGCVGIDSRGQTVAFQFVTCVQDRGLDVICYSCSVF